MAVNSGRTNENSLDFDFIDVEELNFSDDQTWLSAQLLENSESLEDHIDVTEYFSDVSNYLKIKHDHGEFSRIQVELMGCIGSITMCDILNAQTDRQKFDSRTYTRPKRRSLRPSLQMMVESGSRTITKHPPSKTSSIVRHKTFTLDVDGANNPVLKDYAAKRTEGNNVNKDDMLVDNRQLSLQCEELSSENALSKPIEINLSEPVHNLHNTFNHRCSISNLDRSISIGRSEDSFMNVSPPSMVSSIVMDASGNFNSGSFISRKGSISSQKDLFLRVSDAGYVIDTSMASSMTNSIMDEKEMNTSFLSQAPCLDSESMLSSLPLSLASSFNSTIASSQFVPKSKPKDNNLNNSGTFTRLVESNDDGSGSKLQFGLKHSLNRLNLHEDFNNTGNKSPRRNISNQSYIVEKENMNDTFIKDERNFLMGDEMNDSFLREIVGKPSLNLTMDKQELNEIISARQKLSLARSSMPSQKIDNTISSQNIHIKKSNEATETKTLVNRFSPVRNGTFRKLTPLSKKDQTFKMPVQDNVDDLEVEDIAYTNISVIDKKVDSIEKIDTYSSSNFNNSSKELCEHTMTCSSDSLEGGATGSSISGSGSPPEVGDDNHVTSKQGIKFHNVTSTPHQPKTNPSVTLLQGHVLSPIVDPDFEDSQIMSSVHSNTIIRNTNSSSLGQLNQAFPEETVTVKRQPGVKSPEKRQSMYAGSIKDSKVLEFRSSNLPSCPPVRKSGLPTSKLRQYSSHKELSKLPGTHLRYPASGLPSRGMFGLRESARSTVYASNPALSPTAPHQYSLMAGESLARKGSYTIMGDSSSSEKEVDNMPLVPARCEFKAPNAPRLVRQIPSTENKRLLNRPREMRESLLPISNYQQEPNQTMPGHNGLPLKGRHNIPAAINLRQTLTGSLQVLNKPAVKTTSNKPIASSTSVKELSQNSRQSADAMPMPSRPMVTPSQSVNSSQIPHTVTKTKTSGLPRPSKLPAPRRSLRPPSTYSLPQTTGDDYDCY